MTRTRYFLAIPHKAAADTALGYAKAQLRSADMAAIACRRDLLIMVDDTTACSTPSERHWLIGDIFGKGDIRLDGLACDVEASARTCLGKLLSKFWGAYICVAQGTAPDSYCVLRDPSGAVPAYWTLANGMVMMSSDLDLLIKAGSPRPSVDWNGLAHFLISPDARPAATCLKGISELRRGEMLTVSPADLHVENLWSPWDHVEPRLSWAEAQDAIRQSIMKVVKHLTQGQGRFLLGLSGGLDSSIVAAALSASGADFSALTLATPDPAGDERAWAAIVADHLSIRLDEAIIDASRIDLTRSHADHLPRPVSRPLRQEIDRLSQEQADAQGAQAHIGGAGGDSVFCHFSSATALTDRLLIGGARSGSWSSLNDLVGLTGVSHGRVIRQALACLPRSRRHVSSKRNLHMLSPALSDHPLPPCHPWLMAPTSALPGKWRHIRELVAIENHMDALRCASDRPHLAPLMTQPVLEAALRVPTWLWCEGGLNRSAARHAFADMLPAEIIYRRSKGAPDSVSARAFEMGRAVLYESLIGGQLDQAGLLDRSQITACLSQPSPLRDHGYLRLLFLANVEAWVTHWQAR